jgi:hypothetical protein
LPIDVLFASSFCSYSFATAVFALKF